ncbi:MAG: GAK system XXXCH domain-containing protein [Desulfovibrionaceae bacterium]|jgi:XXXCH domain-containing protein|nr:GAK system XXXCH domain-containing protein [Desulfovibrionaceae bacterium]
MNFKTLKSELDTVFRRITDSAASGEAPSLDDVNAFVRLLQKLIPMAEDIWADELEDFVHMAKQLLQAVKHGKVEDCILIVDSLNDAQEYCHRTFKG